MAKTVYEVYVANPTTQVLDTDLIYCGKSPYTVSDDSAFLISALIPTRTQGGLFFAESATKRIVQDATNLFWDDSNNRLAVLTNTPVSGLSVAGNVSIGSTYATTNAAPTNGMLVEGDTAIGATSANNKLTVGGSFDLTGDIQLNGTSKAIFFEGNATNNSVAYLSGSASVSLAADSFTMRYGKGLGNTGTDGITLQASGDVFIRNALGIGTASPANTTDIAGNAVIGGTYGGSASAPADGLLVEGGIGQGITSPQGILHSFESATTIASYNANGVWFFESGAANARIVLAGSNTNTVGLLWQNAGSTDEAELYLENSTGDIVSTISTTEALRVKANRDVSLNSNTFYFDITNERLGIGAGSSPTYALHIATSSAKSLQARIENGGLNQTAICTVSSTNANSTALYAYFDAKAQAARESGIRISDDAGNYYEWVRPYQAGATITQSAFRVNGSVRGRLYSSGDWYLSELFYLDYASRFAGVNTTSPVARFEVESGQLVIDAASFALTKFNSQGVAWNTLNSLPSIIFNGISTDRPEISWIRGTSTYPEFSIREHTTNNVGGQIWTGNGSGTTTLTMSFYSGKVGVGTVAAPVNTLDIEGALAVGATYSGTSIAPTNGALIEGDVVIGTTTLSGTNLQVYQANNCIIEIGGASNCISKLLFTEAAATGFSILYDGSSGSGVANQAHLRGEISGSETNIMTLRMDGTMYLNDHEFFLRSYADSTGGSLYSIGYDATNGFEIKSDNLITFIESDATSTVAQFDLNQSRFVFGQATVEAATLSSIQASATGAIPALFLEQQDQDFAFLRLEGDVTGTATPTSCITTVTTGYTLQGAFKIQYSDYGGMPSNVYVPFYTIA